MCIWSKIQKNRNFVTYKRDKKVKLKKNIYVVLGPTKSTKTRRHKTKERENKCAFL